MRLDGKTAVVTGGGSGFGAGISRAFAAEGAKVMIADLNADAAKSVAAEVGGYAVTTNVADNASVAGLAYAVADQLGDLDILVNNAGTTHAPGAMEDVNEEEFDRVFAVNAKSVYLTARHLVPAMKARKSGVILNIASAASVSPRPNLIWYSASKGWMITTTKAMAIELAPYNIRVNALNPVAGDTPLLADFMGGESPEMREKFLSGIPLGRFSTPDDIGAAATFLCSDSAGLITGVALEIDGGRTI